MTTHPTTSLLLALTFALFACGDSSYSPPEDIDPQPRRRSPNTSNSTTSTTSTQTSQTTPATPDCIPACELNTPPRCANTTNLLYCVEDNYGCPSLIEFPCTEHSTCVSDDQRCTPLNCPTRIWDGDFPPNNQNLPLSELDGYTRVNGSLTLDGTILDLEPSQLGALYCLRFVRDTIHITQTPLRDLSFLRRIRGVQHIAVQNNRNLTTLGLNFSELTSLDSITIADNPHLADLSALSNLEALRVLYLRNLPRLTTLHGIHSTTHIQQLHLENLPRLSSLSALENLTSFGSIHLSRLTSITSLNDLNISQDVNSNGHITIEYNANLTSLNGLSSLQHLSALNILDNPQLQNLDGLQNLTQLGALTLYNNNLLTDLSALGPLEVPAHSIEIFSNNSLCPSEIDALLERIYEPNPHAPPITIQNNGTCEDP